MPTVSHVDVALPLIDAGVSVLVEKPLASSLADADRLIEAAARRGVVLAAGHTERFNPAVVAALPLVSNPRFVEVHRLGTFPERSLDIDVVFDLMIHDLDLLLTSVKSEVTSIEAIGVNVLTPRTDIANVRLRFASGCIANVTASRISRDKVRKVRFFQRDSYLSIDYAAQEAEIYRLVAQNGRPGIEGGKLDVQRDEPLRAELADFVDAVRHRREPGVSGRAGRDALELARGWPKRWKDVGVMSLRDGMTTVTTFDLYMDRINRGDRLTPEEIRELAATPDILSLGMLADTLRRRLHGTRVTFLRVADVAFDGVDGSVPAGSGARSAAHRGRLPTWTPPSPRSRRRRAVAGDRTVAGFSWVDVDRWSAGVRPRAGADATQAGRAGRDCGSAARQHRRSCRCRAEPEGRRLPAVASDHRQGLR